MSIRVLALAVGGLLACSGPAAPTPAADAPPPPTAAKPDSKAPAAVAKPDERPMSLMPPINVPAPAKEPPLTQEEKDLIAADPATLSPEMRRKRAFARRREILQNPDSPAARQLEALRLAHESGELQAQMPDKSRDGGLTLNARNPGPPRPPSPRPTSPRPQSSRDRRADANRPAALTP